jgi:dTDP-4-dehydrorhamnose reductase
MQPILITGATGTLGRAFARICGRRGLAHVSASRRELDIADPASIERTLDAHAPWLVVNTAGYVRVDDAEDDHHRCRRDNTTGAGLLALACARRGVALVTFSSDLVFDGAKRAPYHEDDVPAPLSVYGRTKAEAEAVVRAAHPDALVVRTSAFFGPWDEHNWVTRALRELAADRDVRVPDGVVSPTYVPDLVDACLDLAIDGEGGLWHVANAGAVSWADLVRGAARRAGLPHHRVREAPAHHLGLRAPRPAFSALCSGRGTLLGHHDDAVARYLRDARPGRTP